MENNNFVNKYCVFWHPTIFHHQLAPIENFASFLFKAPEEKRTETKTSYIIEDEISDNIGQKHNIKITLYKTNKGLTIESRIGEERNTLDLKFVDLRRNGLALYEYKADEKSKSIERVLSHGIYHITKSFYHSHELRSGSDAALYAYTIDADPKKKFSLEEDDNPALVHFLALYEQKFKHYAKSISDDFAYLEKCMNEKAEKKRTIDRSRILNSFCENALIEYVYCKTLFESKYNKLIKIGANDIKDPELYVDCLGEGIQRKDLYKIALNIENSIRYIRYIQQKNWKILDVFSSDITHAALETSRKATNASIVLGIISVLLGVLAVCLAC